MQMLQMIHMRDEKRRQEEAEIRQTMEERKTEDVSERLHTEGEIRRQERKDDAKTPGEIEEEDWHGCSQAGTAQGYRRDRNLPGHFHSTHTDLQNPYRLLGDKSPDCA